MVYLKCRRGWYHIKLLLYPRVLCTPYNHAPCHFLESHIRKVHAYLAVTCRLHFWQNDRDLFRATAVTWGWNEYRDRPQSAQKVDPGDFYFIFDFFFFIPPLLQGFEPDFSITSPALKQLGAKLLQHFNMNFSVCFISPCFFIFLDPHLEILSLSLSDCFFSFAHCDSLILRFIT